MNAEGPEYPRIERRDYGRKKWRVVYDKYGFTRRPRYFKTYAEAGEHLDHWLNKKAATTWRPII